jgi:hypothetical protein
MNRRTYKCPKCRCRSVCVLKMYINDNCIVRRVRCRRCEYVYSKRQSLLSKEAKYHVISIQRGRERALALHRWVWEQVHGRRLETWEHIHHINGNPGDNRPDNLKMMTSYEHASHHTREKIANGTFGFGCRKNQ